MQIRLGSKGHLQNDFRVVKGSDGCAMLMSPNKDEAAVHGCHCRGDMAVRMRKVLQTAGLVFECHLLFRVSKSIPVFRRKLLENHTLWGGTYLYSLYRGVPPRDLAALHCKWSVVKVPKIACPLTYCNFDPYCWSSLSRHQNKNRKPFNE